MSSWTHSICLACWEKKNPNRQAVTLRESLRDLEMCCFCGDKHRSGIYVRENFADLHCNGTEGIHKGE